MSKISRCLSSVSKSLKTLIFRLIRVKVGADASIVRNLKPTNTLAKVSLYLCVSVGALLFSVGSISQQTDMSKLPRQIAPHLFRIHGDYELPRAIVVPEGEVPQYSLNNLATWRCTESVNPEALPTCGQYFISQRPIALKQQAVVREKAKNAYGHTRYTVQTTDGQRLDVWTTEFGCNYSPDGSRLQVGVIEDRVSDLRSPWGPEPYNNVTYNNLLHPGHLPYLQRVAPNGQVLWAYVYLVKTTGRTEDKGGYPEVEDPLLGFGEVVCPKSGGSTGFLTSTVIRQGTFTFGAFAMEIDTVTGQPKVKNSRIRVVPAVEVEKHYRRALDELTAEGVITEKDTKITAERFRSVSPPSRFLSKDDEFSERLRRNLLTAYFINTTQGDKK